MNRCPRAAIVALLGLLHVTCQRPPETETAALPAGSSPTAPAPRVAAPVASRASAPNTTPGKIKCGDVSCDVETEVCCADFTGGGARCAKRPADLGDDVCGGSALTKYCDGAEDCPGGACCETAACTGDCPPLYACESPRCETQPGGVCQGGACPHGFRCATSGAEASCVLANPGVHCGTKRCEGDTPLCCWNVKTKQSSCGKSCPGDGMGDSAQLACAGVADCGGYACGRFSSSPAKNYACAGHSFAGDRFSPILCASLADCPKQFGVVASTCASPGDDSLPPNAKVCGYEEAE